MDNYDPPASELIGMMDAAIYAHRSPENMRQAAHRGRLWSIQVARNLLTTRAAVDAYLVAHGNDGHSRWLRQRRA